MGATCQNSSVTMVLNHYEARIHPDEITREFTRLRAQDPHGVKEVYNTLTSRFSVPPIETLDTETISDLTQVLDRGKLVIVYGLFSDGGHLLVVVGYDENGYYVNDFAGTWSERWKGGYPNIGRESDTSGKGNYYQKQPFEAAVFTWDGRRIGTGYLHIPR